MPNLDVIFPEGSTSANSWKWLISDEEFEEEEDEIKDSEN